MKMRFYRCNVCGKIIAVLFDTGTPTLCCGEPMRELIPNRADGAAEKHVPVFFEVDRVITVRVGSTSHPMTDSHRILWIGLRTARCFRFMELHPGDRPEAVFLLDPGDKVEEVYALCDIHGLWCSEKESDIWN